jgi:hypothetical protein
MTTIYLQPPLPAADKANLAPLFAGLPVLAFLATGGHGAASASVLEKALSPLYADAGAMDAALGVSSGQGLLLQTKAGHYRITDAGRGDAERQLGPLLGRNWPHVCARSLAALAVGLDPRAPGTQAYLARKENLESAALARLYGIKGLGDLPSRVRVRFALLRAILIARLPECEPAFMETPMRNPSRDVIGRTVMLGAASLKRGTIREAESVLVRKALGLPHDAKGGIAEALVRAGLARSGQRHQPSPKAEIRGDKLDLPAFAATVRDLAKTLQTHPFAGRVAIAQVYDAGVLRGLAFGALDEFKSRIAEAGRAGLLDLERYDVAGPMDNALRERSRTPFGRDERHFIVNEWI